MIQRRRNLGVLLFAVLAGGVLGCSSPPPSPPPAPAPHPAPPPPPPPAAGSDAMQGPHIQLAFKTVPNQDDQARLTAAFPGAKPLNPQELGTTGASFGFDVPLNLGSSFTPQQFTDALRNVHETVCGVKDASGGQIASNDRVFVRLDYESTGAQAVATLTMQISFEPADASLRIDLAANSGIAEIDKNRKGGMEAAVATGGKGVFKMSVPLSFISKNPFVYYRVTSRDGASTHYYEFDMTQGRPREVPNINSLDDWNAYTTSKGGPAAPK
jgi:hypothetical protein